jgi:hypothetical protein
MNTTPIPTTELALRRLVKRQTWDGLRILLRKWRDLNLLPPRLEQYINKDPLFRHFRSKRKLVQFILQSHVSILSLYKR